MTIRQIARASAALAVVGALVALRIATGAAPAPATARATAPATATPAVNAPTRIEPVRPLAPEAIATPASIGDAPRVEAPSEAPSPALPASLDIELDGASTSWALAQIRGVPRAGGTHDVRELTAALLGRTDVTVRIVGVAAEGDTRRATIDLGALDGREQVRVWPELDGTWTVARNRASDDGNDTVEAYRLTGVRALAFAADR